jgi:hypothetical protein
MSSIPLNHMVERHNDHSDVQAKLDGFPDSVATRAPRCKRLPNPALRDLATDKQLTLLRRLHIDYHSHITRAQASARISRALGNR